MERGDIWWASLPEALGSEPGFRRPLLIVQDDTFNASRIRTVVALAITSNVGLAKAPGNIHLAVQDSGLPQPSVVNVSQIITVDRTLLTERIRRLSKQTMADIDKGLRLVLGL